MDWNEVEAQLDPEQAGQDPFIAKMEHAVDGAERDSFEIGKSRLESDKLKAAVSFLLQMHELLEERKRVLRRCAETQEETSRARYFRLRREVTATGPRGRLSNRPGARLTGPQAGARGGPRGQGRRAGTRGSAGGVARRRGTQRCSIDRAARLIHRVHQPARVVFGEVWHGRQGGPRERWAAQRAFPLEPPAARAPAAASALAYDADVADERVDAQEEEVVRAVAYDRPEKDDEGGEGGGGSDTGAKAT